jgi:hypothetical protein
MELLALHMNYIVTVAIALGGSAGGCRVYCRRWLRMGCKGQRLGIREYHETDKTRRLVLVRRDETEHLIRSAGPRSSS